MNKLILILFLLVSKNIFSIEYNMYSLDVEHIFRASDKRERNIEYITVNNNPGSGALALGPALFFIDTQLVLFDQANNDMRTILLDKDYNISEEYKDSFYNMAVSQFDNIYIGYNQSYITGFNAINGWYKDFNISIYDFEFFRNYKDIYYQNNTLFIFDENNKLWGIREPSEDSQNNSNNIVEENILIKEIKSGKYEGLTIDDDKRLFYKGEIKTINYETFYNYYISFHPEKTKLSNDFYVEGFLIEVSPKSSEYMTYLSKDKYNNSYFLLAHRYITVFNSNGLLNEFFEIDLNNLDTYPAVSPEGDVYFLEYGEDSVTLYKVERQW